MRFSSALCIGLLLTFTAVQAGNITGIVRAEGKPGTEDNSSSEGHYASRKFKFAERVDYARMRDFVVYIDGLSLTNNAAAPAVQAITTRRINQKGAAFSPHVLPIVVGTTVEWPNEDEIFHNVFSISEAKPFDLGLYKQPELKRITFDKPGRVDAFCSIHKAMNCIILVLENPVFASTDAHGRYRITDVPPGTYKLKAWHERMPSLTKSITVPPEGDVQVDFTLGIFNLPNY